MTNTQSTFNTRNQLTAQQPGGFLRVRGATDESSSVKVKSNNNPFTNAQTNNDKEFTAWVPTTFGQNTITIEAKDDSPNANTKTQSYTVNITGQSRTPSYDFNGNMTSNGTGQTYQWDAENRLIKITYADGSITSFQYNGLSQRTRITERNAANIITSDKRYLWSDSNQPAEERDATTHLVTKRFFAQGEQRIGGADAGFYYYAKDHLGSVREITTSSGTVAARYDFDLWGKRTKLSGTLDTEVGFTGHHHHTKSGLVLTWYRVYDADSGTWLSADPIEEEEGLNLYGYVENDSVNQYDELGLQSGRAIRNPRSPGTRIGPLGSPTNPFVFRVGAGPPRPILATGPNSRQCLATVRQGAITPPPTGSTSPNQGHPRITLNFQEGITMGYRFVGQFHVPIRDRAGNMIGIRNFDSSRIFRFPDI